MMEVNELMIGDWCAYGVNCKGRVTALTDNLITLSVDGNEINGRYMLMPDMVNPIPLAEDILDNNNFFQDNKYFTLAITKETRIVLKHIDKEDNKWYACVITVFDEIGHAYVHYVHQLQHLLRLCGTNKEIEL
jgi:hypothetical protein